MDRCTKRLMYLTIAIGCLVILLSGCATKEVVVSKPETKYITIPEELFKDCQATRPPAVAVYKEANARQKEELLTAYSSALLKDLVNCTDNIDAIRKYQNRQLQIMKDAAK